LAGGGEAIPAAKRLPDAVAEAATEATSVAFALDTPGAPNAAVAASDEVAPAFEPVQGRAAAPVRPMAPSATAAPSPTLTRASAWLRAAVPEAGAPGLTLAQRRLLAVALSVHRSPTMARSASLALALGALGAPPPRSVSAERSAVPTSSDQAVSEPRGPRVPLAAPETLARDIAHGEPIAAPPAMPGSGPAMPSPPRRTVFHPNAIANSGSGPAPPVEAGTDARRRPPVIAANPSVVEPPAQSAAETTSVATLFGGLFYLLNVALSFGLYGDFTQPRRPGIALSPWDFLAMTGQAWFGAAVREDPVWSVLAELAGRAPSMPPGSSFIPPADWSAPSEWVQALSPPATLHAAATRARVILFHPAGFALAQAARELGDTPMRAAARLAMASPTLRGILPRRRPMPLLPRAPRARWLTLLLGAFAARLGQVLDVPAAEAPALLCQHSARLTVTPTELIVRLDLSELPIAIRMAGLDRDPGWIPAAGRAVAFRFT
jgi:hypothetical protein